jgi:DNA polymerase-3 subunit alpha
MNIPTGRAGTKVPIAHLHLHTDHSFLDGVGTSAEYAELAKAAGHTHIAITDHGGLHGLPEHRRACQSLGIKPVYGCELYVADRLEPSEDGDVAGGHDHKADKDYHLVALCQSQSGWSNLLAINHHSVKQGFYRKPRTTHDFVLNNSDGLIVTTACIASKFGRLAIAGRTKELRELMATFRDAMPGRFFCELHLSDLDLQAKANSHLIPIAKELGVPIVWACDVHYACSGDCKRQDEMIAVARRTPVDDPQAFKLSVRSLYYMNAKEAVDHATSIGCPLSRSELVAAIARSSEIASTCSADIYPSGELKPPRFAMPDGRVVADTDATLARVARLGLDRKLAQYPELDRDTYTARLEHELSIINKCKMSAFFLVTLDIVRECRRRGVLVWTRGSGCASLVAAVVGITPIDPIRFGLLFERFVDPSRPGAPDFDLDIAADRRDEIAAWFCQKYGGPNGDCVARIGALSTFGIKSALRDVLFARSANPKLAHELSRISDDLPDEVVAKVESMTIANRDDVIEDAMQAIRSVAPERFRGEIDSNDDSIRAALSFVGRVRGKATHAAGFVASPDPLQNHIPVDRGIGGRSAEVVTAWIEGQAAQHISPTGLMKVDLLGLETVAVVGALLPNGIDCWGIDYENPVVLKELSSGDGHGIHQLAESDQRLASIVKALRPKSVDDLIAAIALYRPGSLQFVETFIRRANGQEHVEAIHPKYDEITKRTYGILVYQEQVMLLLSTLGGMALRDAYGIIKAISKKDAAKIAAAKDGFIAYSTTKASPPLRKDAAERIFGVVYDFAGYSFNAAHAASYGVLSWITAMLRATRRDDFFLSLLNRTPNQSAKRADADRKLALTMKAAESLGCRIRPPMVGASSDRWTIDRSGIRAPLCVLLGVSETSAKAISDAAKSAIATPDPFCEFIRWALSHKKLCNSKSLDSLACSGALRSLLLKSYTSIPSGEQAWALSIDAIAMLKEAKAKPTHVASMMSSIVNNPNHDCKTTVADPELFSIFEAKALGFSHWVSPWKINSRIDKVRALVAAGRLRSPNDRGPGRRAFLVSSVRNHKDKRGRTMGFLTLQPHIGSPMRATCFSGSWKPFAAVAKPGSVIIFSCSIERDGQVLVANEPKPVSVDRISADLIASISPRN